MTRPNLAIRLLLLLPAAVLAGEPPPAGPEGPATDPAAHATHDTAAHHPEDTPAPAARWPADAALGLGMQRVRAATEALAHGEHDPLDAGQVQGIARELRLAVDDMFAKCRLDPAPDAALHQLLARVLGASRVLEAGVFDAAALAELRAVLARYPQLFYDTASVTTPAPAAGRADGGRGR